MGFLEFLKKFKKPILVIGGATAAIAALVYLMPDDKEEKISQD